MTKSKGEYPEIKSGDLIENRFRVIKQVGRGNFSTVYSCHDLWAPVDEPKVPLALKIVKKEYTEDSRYEVVMLRTIDAKDPQHAMPVPRLYHYFTWNHYPALVMSIHGMELKRCRRGMAQGNVSRNEVIGLTKCLLTALSFLHGVCRMVHTDLKPENILQRSASATADSFGRDWVICDYGSASFYNPERLDDDLISTRPYRAAEVVLGNPWYFPADMWSLGCIVYEVICGEQLFNVHNERDHLSEMQRLLGPLPPLLSKRSRDSSKYFDESGALLLPSGPSSGSRRRTRSAAAGARVSSNNGVINRLRDRSGGKQLPGIHTRLRHEPELLELVVGLLEYDPEKRLTAVDALQMPLFTQFSPNRRVRDKSTVTGSGPRATESFLAKKKGGGMLLREEDEAAYPSDLVNTLKGDDASALILPVDATNAAGSPLLRPSSKPLGPGDRGNSPAAAAAPRVTDEPPRQVKAAAGACLDGVTPRKLAAPLMKIVSVPKEPTECATSVDSPTLEITSPSAAGSCGGATDVLQDRLRKAERLECNAPMKHTPSTLGEVISIAGSTTLAEAATATFDKSCFSQLKMGSSSPPESVDAVVALPELLLPVPNLSPSHDSYTESELAKESEEVLYVSGIGRSSDQPRGGDGTHWEVRRQSSHCATTQHPPQLLLTPPLLGRKECQVEQGGTLSGAREKRRVSGQSLAASNLDADNVPGTPVSSDGVAENVVKLPQGNGRGAPGRAPVTAVRLPKLAGEKPKLAAALGAGKRPHPKAHELPQRRLSGGMSPVRPLRSSLFGINSALDLRALREVTATDSSEPPVPQNAPLHAKTCTPLFPPEDQGMLLRYSLHPDMHNKMRTSTNCARISQLGVPHAPTSDEQAPELADLETNSLQVSGPSPSHLPVPSCLDAFTPPPPESESQPLSGRKATPQRDPAATEAVPIVQQREKGQEQSAALESSELCPQARMPTTTTAAGRRTVRQSPSNQSAPVKATSSHLWSELDRLSKQHTSLHQRHAGTCSPPVRPLLAQRQARYNGIRRSNGADTLSPHTMENQSISSSTSGSIPPEKHTNRPQLTTSTSAPSLAGMAKLKPRTVEGAEMTVIPGPAFPNSPTVGACRSESEPTTGCMTLEVSDTPMERRVGSQTTAHPGTSQVTAIKAVRRTSSELDMNVKGQGIPGIDTNLEQSRNIPSPPTMAGSTTVCREGGSTRGGGLQRSDARRVEELPGACAAEVSTRSDIRANGVGLRRVPSVGGGNHSTNSPQCGTEVAKPAPWIAPNESLIEHDPRANPALDTLQSEAATELGTPAMPARRKSSMNAAPASALASSTAPKVDPSVISPINRCAPSYPPGSRPGVAATTTGLRRGMSPAAAVTTVAVGQGSHLRSQTQPQLQRQAGSIPFGMATSAFLRQLGSATGPRSPVTKNVSADISQPRQHYQQQRREGQAVAGAPRTNRMMQTQKPTLVESGSQRGFRGVTPGASDARVDGSMTPYVAHPTRGTNAAYIAPGRSQSTISSGSHALPPPPLAVAAASLFPPGPPVSTAPALPVYPQVLHNTTQKDDAHLDGPKVLQTTSNMTMTTSPRTMSLSASHYTHSVNFSCSPNGGGCNSDSSPSRYVIASPSGQTHCTHGPLGVIHSTSCRDCCCEFDQFRLGGNANADTNRDVGNARTTPAMGVDMSRTGPTLKLRR